MAKLKNLTDKERLEVVEEEIRKFNKLAGGYWELLEEIGRL